MKLFSSTLLLSHQGSVYDSQQWWQSMKCFMLQCMLGTINQNSAISPSKHCGINTFLINGRLTVTKMFF